MNIGQFERSNVFVTIYRHLNGYLLCSGQLSQGNHFTSLLLTQRDSCEERKRKPN